MRTGAPIVAFGAGFLRGCHCGHDDRNWYGQFRRVAPTLPDICADCPALAAAHGPITMLGSPAYSFRRALYPAPGNATIVFSPVHLLPFVCFMIRVCCSMPSRLRLQSMAANSAITNSINAVALLATTRRIYCASLVFRGTITRTAFQCADAIELP